MVEEGEAKTVEYVPEMQLVHRLDMVPPVSMLYLPAWHDSQFTPDQFAGGLICPRINGTVEFHPPTP